MEDLRQIANMKADV